MARKRVVALQHERVATLGWLGDALAERQLEVEVIDVWDGQPVPQKPEFDALVSLGGNMAAFEEAEYPWLVAEKELVCSAVDGDVPVFGICLGGQIVADALGGGVHRAPVPEVGYRSLDLTDAGRDDPVTRHLDSPVLLWHQDTFELPPGATLLATSPVYPQAFRVGSALGVQFHPETSPAMLRAWLDLLGREPVYGGRVDINELLPEADRLADALRGSALRQFRGWIATAGL